MELVHNFKISLGLVLQRERQGRDEESSVRWDPLRLQGGVKEVQILVTLRSQDLTRKWTDRQLEPATDAHQLLGVMSIILSAYRVTLLDKQLSLLYISPKHYRISIRFKYSIKWGNKKQKYHK